METSNPDVADSSATVSDVLKTETDSVTQAINDSPRFFVDQVVFAIFKGAYYRAKVYPLVISLWIMFSVARISWWKHIRVTIVSFVVVMFQKSKMISVQVSDAFLSTFE